VNVDPFILASPTVIPVSLTGPVLWGAASWGASWIFSAYASSLDEPTEKDTRQYRQWYRFVHALAGNLDKLKSGGAK
jgi:hypothetical protein